METMPLNNLSKGLEWNYSREFPNYASQQQVDDGVEFDLFVSPATLAAWAATSPAIVHQYRRVSINTVLLVTDDTVDCDATLTVFLPDVTSVTDNEVRNITNSGPVGTVVTIQAFGGDLIIDTNIFDIYEGESLAIQKGDNKWIVK